MEHNEVVERLLVEDEEFKKVFEKHREYNRKIEKMEKKEFLSKDEQVEKKKLKKLKLNLKDELEKKIMANA